MSAELSSQEFAAHGPRLRRVLGRVLGADTDAADLLHDVYVAALEGMNRLEDPAALSAWLSQIAVNVARAHIRWRVRDRAALQLLSVYGDRAQPFKSSPAELPFAIEQLLGTLPVEERAPAALRYLADYELSDVAAACHVSVPTVKRRLASAKRRLQRHVDV